MVETYSVGEVTAYIRELFEVNEPLQDLWVMGEVSSFSRPASGHWYFKLKDGDDGKALLNCVMWRSHVARQSMPPKEGDVVLVHGAVGIYEAQGQYQLYADLVRPMGIGNLYLEFERLKTRLAEEGLFDEERKRPLPAFPRCIGIVTSADAAALQDVRNVLRRRYPLARVILSACLVQGNNAPPEICAALDRFNHRDDVDVILLVRGGGSIEDLWAFNDERVARAIVASRVPVISGVGHETDFTIADFAADLRAPTPSVAAELATPNVDDLRAAVRAADERLTRQTAACLVARRDDVDGAARALRRVSPAVRLRGFRQRVDDWSARVAGTETARLALLRERLAARTAALHAANPDHILARGYAIVRRTEDGARVASVDDAAPGTAVTIRVQDGELKGRIEDKDSHERYARTLF